MRVTFERLGSHEYSLPTIFSHSLSFSSFACTYHYINIRINYIRGWSIAIIILTTTRTPRGYKYGRVKIYDHVTGKYRYLYTLLLYRTVMRGWRAGDVGPEKKK